MALASRRRLWKREGFLNQLHVALVLRSPTSFFINDESSHNQQDRDRQGKRHILRIAGLNREPSTY